MEARLLWEQEVAGSTPASPTIWDVGSGVLGDARDRINGGPWVG